MEKQKIIDDLERRIDEALKYLDSVTYITKSKIKKILKGENN